MEYGANNLTYQIYQIQLNLSLNFHLLIRYYYYNIV